ncbi:hypothetical protein Angca_004741 [Angiostrongylus cantonensis]|nr:hypothetical protein Angca_004741 [Angiostrongylus cantonensis]
MSTDVELSKKKGNDQSFLSARDTPKPLLALMYGFQQVMVCVSALLTVPFLVTDTLCAGSDSTILLNELISSTFVVSGLSTIIQTMFGMRLALLQGTAFAYVPSVQVFMGQCLVNSSTPVPKSEYYSKLALMQGSLMAAACMPMLIGFTGVVGVLTKFIGPLTVSPLMLLLAFSQVGTMVDKISLHWVAAIQAVTLFITILYLADVLVVLPGIKRGKLHWYRTNLFGQYPYLIAIVISWVFCVVLTVFNLVEPGSPARVDIPRKVSAIRNSAWIAVPYPGKFGMPSFDVSLFLAFLLSSMTSVFESVGDYHAAARVSQERSPPSHAINRGILAEGMGTLLSGLLGPAVGMTTHTENIGVIGVTRVASRWTMVVAGLLLIVLGVSTKIGAILSTIPDPLVGGILGSSMAMVVGVAVSNLQTVDMSISRNMGILGFSMLFGMIVPEYFKRYPVDTGVHVFDDVINVLLKLQMFVGAMCACFLDNTVGGATREQRGLRPRGIIHEISIDDDTYSYSPIIMKFLNKVPFINYFPCVPKEKKATNKVAEYLSDDHKASEVRL